MNSILKLFFTPFFTIFFASASLQAADVGPETGYQDALRLLQEQKSEEASRIFEQAYRAGKDFPALFYNWGLAAYYMNKKGLALGLWRRALYLNPEFTTASQALQFVAAELPKDSSANSLSAWAAFRNHFLAAVSLNKLLATTWLFLVIAGFLLIRYAGQRIHALRNESPLPKKPVIGGFFSILAFFFIFASAAKIFVLFETRATVIASRVVLRTGPTETDNPLFELIEGFNVVIRQIQAPSDQESQGWALVTLDSGASGWIPTPSLFQHSGQEKLW